MHGMVEYAMRVGKNVHSVPSVNRPSLSDFVGFGTSAGQ